MKWLGRSLLVVLWIASIDFVFGLGALLGQFDPSRAEGSITRAVKVFGAFGMNYEICGGGDPLQCGFRDASGREEVDCSAYLGEDPLLGPDAQGGSVWGVLGDKLIADGHYDNVLVLPFGIGGSSLSQWQQDGVLYPLLQHSLDAINTAGIEPSHILWHQGESDAGQGTSEEAYFEMFEALVTELREHGYKAPVSPAVATYCLFTYIEPEPGYEERREVVRAAQLRLPEIDGVEPGPDTDLIQGERYRHDSCHFSARGMQAHADAWLEALVTPHNQLSEI